MIMTSICASLPPVLSNNSKVIAMETTLQQSLLDYKDLLIDFEQLHIENDDYKTQLIEQKEKCDSKNCNGANDLKKVIESKQTIIQLIASAVTRLSETKNWNILEEIFKIIFEEETPLTHSTSSNNKQMVKVTTIKQELVSPKKELHSSTEEELSFRDESVSEIEGTPTGRSSPIIQTKKLKTSMVALSDRDKKKCPDTWPTPESKALKLSFTTPTRSKQNSKLRQSRLNIVKVKTSSVIDITSSPEFSGGSRCSRKKPECNVQTIKKEPMENEDTILPSPTSGPTNFTLFKSPIKFKKPPPLSLKSKTEKTKHADHDAENKNIKAEKNNTHLENTKKCIDIIKTNDSMTYTQEDSINILHPNRLPANFIKSSPVKQRPAPEDTFFDSQASVSLLQHVDKLDDIHKDDLQLSPSKRPLAENINVTNIPSDDELQASMSLLQHNTKPSRTAADVVKRKLVAPVPEPYEDRVPRTRAEKRMLPGWACAECVEFFGELHKDDPEMMRKKINECSHHRGWKNPERPRTPPGYWNPRWNVPEDTEEFNRRNNV